MTITHHTLTTLVLPSLACCHTNSLLPRQMPKQCHYGLSLSGYFHLISDCSTYSRVPILFKSLILRCMNVIYLSAYMITSTVSAVHCPLSRAWLRRHCEANKTFHRTHRVTRSGVIMLLFN